MFVSYVAFDVQPYFDVRLSVEWFVESIQETIWESVEIKDMLRIE